MLKMIVMRLLGVALVLLAVSALVFAFGALIPGDMTSVIVGQEGATQEQFEAVRQRLGLDKPLPVQYVNWLANALQGDFGTSPITGRSVASDLVRQFPVSLELALLTLLVSTAIGLPAGIVAAVHANRRLDVLIRVTLLFTFSVPIFVIGILLLLVGSRWAPDLFHVSFTPWSEDPVMHVRSMAMPLLTIAFPITAMTMQMTRASMLEVLHAPYVVTARAGGVREKRIEYLHALRNALPPIVTFIGFQLGILLGGLIVVEQIFSLPGLGRGMLEAINTRDYPMVTATTLVFATAFVIINALVDLLYPLLDPRQRGR
ncbi:ABC transporter permease [Actibacterium sp. MT2.3-13A]|uniref:ABC transporter permease n=1 Tax=Actibacterium sp. MT2.3-13A TaxID=2828332 RepID=UPI001BA76D7F|nr:ABC transporter permease [Actibacterium sp. MT2.3-13A]